mmetsp:Transcript_427/g.1099  ORF Transcript_427/g.1099 Transcript_427/m.1099 type:complete len:310 (+) Transcript_427:141-1070(+)|eukprot:CAMPEP_0172363888 /NCGR_PEP_ID=MMETSP1060-20121228/7128_1 /TAXON_ID=37318 /ORGANISM="Pseudo-nitzschia pungens, Strain cf. cingulata" /LENGTH=309 /DNA_ID=CAMNT_0013086743 /DNA_START=79 /DNA_END=1008 /DNA_ORIENTATION=-
MCGPTNSASKSTSNVDNDSRLLLFSVESFKGHGGVPNAKAQSCTVAFLVFILVAIEMSSRQFFTAIKHMHPILEDETSRNILARHIGVDAFSCFTVAFLGWKARHVVQDLIDATIGGRKNAMPVAYEKRMFTYEPEGQRVALFFLAYQIKNTYDTLVWNDGIIFIIHHVLTLLTTWGGIQGNAHFYALFFFGFSESSTGVLCLLANFDDEFGVVGLADAFPMVKVVLGGLFAVLFVICRVLMWSTFSYYYCRDVWYVLSGSNPRLELPGHRAWFRFTFLSLSILSLLQIIWLGEIARVGKEELEKMGLL